MKLQPNFSWQKYEGKPEDQKEQFQYQLQQQHIQVANSVNATIDDESFFTRERQTAFTWVDGKAIWTKTVTGTIADPSTNATPHGITGLNKIVGLTGMAQDAEPITTLAVTLPYVDIATPTDSISLYMDLTNVYVNVNTAASVFNGYVFSATIYYTKT